MSKKKLFLSGMRDGVPIALGYFAVSFALGITAGKAGFSAFQAFVASLLNNASAGEYAAIALIASGAGFLEVALMELVANARYFLMACTLSQKFSPDTPFYHRLLIGFDLTDEIFAINVTRKGYIEPAYAYGAIVTVLPGWSVGTALGVIVGDVIPAFAVSALGVAIFGMFIAIIVPPAVKNRVIAVTVLASFALSTAVNKLSFFDFIPEGTKTIILTVVIALAAAIIRPIPTDEDCE
jgi:predicted branched-subunit amino acid permease